MTMYPQDTWLLGGLAWYEPPSTRAASRRHCSFAERLRPLELRGGGPFVGCTGGQTVFVMRRDTAVRLKKNDEVDGVGFARRSRDGKHSRARKYRVLRRERCVRCPESFVACEKSKKKIRFPILSGSSQITAVVVLGVRQNRESIARTARE